MGNIFFVIIVKYCFVVNTYCSLLWNGTYSQVMCPLQVHFYASTLKRRLLPAVDFNTSRRHVFLLGFRSLVDHLGSVVDFVFGLSVFKYSAGFVNVRFISGYGFTVQTSWPRRPVGNRFSSNRIRPSWWTRSDEDRPAQPRGSWRPYGFRSGSPTRHGRWSRSRSDQLFPLSATWRRRGKLPERFHVFVVYKNVKLKFSCLGFLDDEVRRH